ncbi:MAG: M1 family peptidase, partial [Gemmatimonadetes bacterium]|nr:M1 family peptidase [Gemmatimonadota bacterium]
PVLQRLRLAERSDTVVHVVTAADLSGATRAGPGQTLRWTFRADSVRDVAYSVTRASVWDAARTAVGDRDGDGSTDFARVDAIYRPTAFRWAQAARYAQHSVRFLSQYTGFSYPWSHMTAVEGGGIIGGGMEYPMMTLIGDYSTAGESALYGVVVHEIAHMWVPMIVSTDERRYSWMDEGTTTFNENQARRDFFPGVDPLSSDRSGYIAAARGREEGEIMRRSDYHYPGAAYVVATYNKPALVLEALRGVLGEETFSRAYREFIARWAFRHPYPWDLWNTFENVSGRDLDWFWHSWYFETWILDQAVESVVSEGGGTRIVIEDRGKVPMPVLLSIRLASGEQLRREIPVESWLAGARSASITVPGQVTQVEIDPELRFPDADRANNRWSR